MSVIGAVATPYGIGGIAVIRLSGENALEVAARAFKPVGGKSLAELKGYEACYGRIYDGEKLVDDGVLLYFQAPKSYTGEDVVEISCHGGILISKAVLQAFFQAGATPAQAGEFTKRAVLNGKLSLTQAEAVIDVINAQSKQFLDYCNVQKQGALYRRLEKITDRLLAVSAQLAVWADYPDEDIPEAQAGEIADRLHLETTELNSLLSSYDTGKILRDGISAAIVGKPNAGKSTLMNLLAGEEKSIVTDIEGTTRDIVEESVDVGGIVLRLADCAGIRETDDPVEKIGVERMKSRLASSQLVLAVFDGSRALEKPDFELIQRLDGKKVICIINKNDLEQQLDTAFLRDKFENIVELSAKNDDNTERLNALIMRLADVENLDMSAGFIANERQRACAVAAKNALIEAENAISSGFTLDVAGIMVEQALESLYELSGKRAGDEIIAEVFKRFCVGK